MMSKKIAQETAIVMTPAGEFYLARPTSVFGGMARHAWVEKLIKAHPAIASPNYWSSLVEQHGVKYLVEYDDDTWEILDND